MRPGIRLVVLSTLLGALLAAHSLAQAQGIITGRVTNGTPGASLPAELTVQLRVFQGPEEKDALEAPIDEKGAFRFEGLETLSGWSYLPMVSYEDVTYSQGVLSFGSGETEKVSELAVYEATNDYGDITAERVHLFLALQGTTLSVTELYVFANPGDRTYVGSSETDGVRWTTRFYLPRAARNLVFEDGTLGGRFIPTENGFADVEPLWPGQTNVMFSYSIDCAAGECDLTRTVTFPVSNLNLLLPDQGAAIVSDQLALEGKIDAQQQVHLNYVGSAISPGEQLKLRVRLPGAPAASGPAVPGSSRLPWFILGGVLTALVLAYPFWVQRVRAGVASGADSSAAGGSAKAGGQRRRKGAS